MTDPNAGASQADSDQHLNHSADPSNTTSTIPSYKRAYKACESCRKTKAKCELEPSATACSKCLREQKDCVFPPHRSSKRAKLSNTPQPNPDSANQSTDIENQQQREQRQQQTAKSSAVADFVTTSSQTDPATKTRWLNRTPSFANTSQQRNHASLSTPQAEMPENTMYIARSNSCAGRGHAQVNLCTPAPETGQPDNLQRDVMETIVTSSKDAIGLLFRAAEHIDSEDSDEQQLDNDMVNDGSAVGGSVYNIRSPSMPSPGLASSETLDLWDQHRFVRQGWFTAREAVSYIEFFFRNLSPLSPVADSYYADHKNHKRLILEEPLLCCTLLMIASRHHVPGNSSIGSRADFIHMRLWKHVEHLIQKITFGAEKYSVAKTRTLGSIQALLLIIEWHPRAIHFPPETDGWDSSLAPSVDDSFQTTSRRTDAGRRWREDVFEPAKRSDRMSWMLVGIATTLAHELGVFDHTDDDDNNSQDGAARRSTTLRTRRLLYLYTSQLSLRLGCTSVFPHGNHQITTSVLVANSPSQEQANVDRENIISKWIEITKLLTTATEMFFASPSATRQMLRSSRYVSLLDHFQPLLARWYTDFTSMSCSTVAEPARQILLVDYHYVRMYINSIAMQALVERASSYNSGDIWLDQSFLRSEFAQDFRFVKEVRESSTNILTIATKLAEDKVLQYCPVRLFLRMVSASIFLLKTISLGSREADVLKSLGQLEKCIEALQTSRADDIHLSSRYAMLIARHVRRFKRNFRIQKPGGVQTASRINESVVTQSVSHVQAQNTSLTTDRLEQLPQFQQQNITGSNSGHIGDDSQSFNKFPTPFLDFDDNGTMQDWLAQPFNSQVAPFGTDWLQPASGLAVDSLDFLWNLST